MQDIQVYKGDLPYIFVSYAHRDTEQVIPILAALQNVGYRIWFDRGIEAGTEWSNNSANHLRQCSAFLFFASHNSVQSENCLDEVAYAKSHSKPALLCYLEEDVALPAGTEMQTARFQRMFATRQADLTDFVKNFSDAVIFNPCRGEAAPAPEPTAPISVPPHKRSKKGLFFALAGAVIAIAILVSCLFIFGPGKNTDSPSQTLTLSDNWTDCTFRLDGIVYKLPVLYSQFTADGWVLVPGKNEDYSEDTYIAGTDTLFVSLIKEGSTIQAGILNPDGHAQKLKDCYIGSIKVSQPFSMDFCIAKDITQDSTPEDLLAAFGRPSFQYDEGNYLSWDWDHGYHITLSYTKNSESASLRLDNFTPADADTPTVEEPPAFLSEYEAPTALGEDLYSGTFLLAGDLYTLPAPLQVFLDKGWQVAFGSQTLVSGGSGYIHLSRGQDELSLSVSNPSPYKTLLENCLVTEISIYESNTLEAILPGNISIGLSREELQSRIPDNMECYEGDYGISYTYISYGDPRFHVRITVDVDTGLVDHMELSLTYDELILP